MATTRLADVIGYADPIRIGQISLEQFPERSAFAQAGVFAGDASYDAMAAGDGLTYQMRFWNIPKAKSTPVNDVPTDRLVLHKISSGAANAVVHYNAMGFSLMEIVKDIGITNADPLQVIANYDATMWAAEVDRYTALGLRAMLDSADVTAPGAYTLDVSTEDGDAATDANMVDADLWLEAMHLAGRGWRDFNVAVITSSVMLRLQQMNLIDYIPDSEGVVRFPSYLGLRLVEVEDEFIVRPGTTSGEVADITFLKQAAVGLGQAKPKDIPPNEFIRDPYAGRGSSAEDYLTRHKWVLGVRGIDWTPATALNTFPTEEQFTDPDNWTLNPAFAGSDLGIVRLRVNV